MTKIRGRALAVLLVAMLVGGGVAADELPEVRGVASGSYYEVDFACGSSPGQGLRLDLTGSFYFGGVPYHGPVHIEEVLLAWCSGDTDEAPFYGENIVNGKSVAGTCVVSFGPTAVGPTPNVRDFDLDCNGRVSSPTGEGPLGRQRLRVAVVAPEPCFPVSCEGLLYGIFYRAV